MVEPALFIWPIEISRDRSIQMENGKDAGNVSGRRILILMIALSMFTLLEKGAALSFDCAKRACSKWMLSSTGRRYIDASKQQFYSGIFKRKLDIFFFIFVYVLGFQVVHGSCFVC